MAILTAVPGIEIAVQSHGQDLPEYPDDGEWSHRKFGDLAEEKRISTYVECQTDAEFRIRIVLKNPYRFDSPSLTFKASVDGHGIAQSTCSADYFNRSYNLFMEIMASKLERLTATEVSSRPLKFTSITKVDDLDSSRVQQDAKLVADIGEIVVSVFRTFQRETLPLPDAFVPSRYKPPKEVAEKALKGKAISHGVTYGPLSIVQRVHKETTDLDGPNSPIAVFVFKYRSRDDLKSELIIPRSPSQKQLHIHFAIAAAIAKEIAEIKAEGEVSSRNRKRPSDTNVLHNGRAYKTSRGPNGSMVIDLTDD